MQTLWDIIYGAILYVDGLVWGAPVILMLFAGGILFSIMGGFHQIRKFGIAWKTMFWKGGARGEVHPFKIWCMVMGATIGVGNIAGASTAIHLGGPGAVFWMWICALVGMATKSFEVTLSVWSRKVLPDGRIQGGTFFYIEKVPVLGGILALLFAVFTFISAYGIGNMIQANNVAYATEHVIRSYGGGDTEVFYGRLAIGLIMAFFTALVVIGGVRRIAEAAYILIPFMSAWYIIFGLGIFAMYWYRLPEVIGNIFRFAFTPAAAFGGLAGWTVYSAIRYGFARGQFSNEAGLGSAPLAYAFAESDHPGRQGFYGVFEVFMDTIVLCSITVIHDQLTGALWERPDLSGAGLASESFYRAYGIYAPVLLGVALGLFAYTTMLTWEFYGEQCVWYFFSYRLKLIPEKVIRWFWRFVWLPPIVFAAVSPELFEAFWDFSDCMNGLMTIPNIIAVIYLSPVAAKLLKDFYTRHLYITGELKGKPPASVPASQILKYYAKDFLRSMFTPTYVLIKENMMGRRISK
ncbi:MAG: sodium:alanine symporter family protein [Thermoprotei archaeon]|nr:MAG: sodium:alanine symporter family protein [Thermoprotei archaeon]